MLDIGGGKETMASLTATRDLMGTIDEIRQHLVAVLEAAKFKVKSVEGDTIKAQSGFSLTSLGSNLSVLLEQTDASTVRMVFNLEPRQKTVMTDWGRSRRELNRILELLEARLSPESSENDLQCPECHASVHDEDVFCANCGSKIA